MTATRLCGLLHRAAVPLLMVGLLLSAACGDSSEPMDDSRPGDTSEGTTDTTSGESGEDAAADRATDERNGVEVLDAGAEPRERLLLQPEVGAELQRTLVANIGLTLEVAGEALPSPTLPATRLVMRAQVDDVADDGTITTTVEFVEVAAVDGPGVDPAVLEQTNAVLEQIKGITGTGTTDRHGGSASVSLDTSTITDPMLRTTLDSLTSQLTELTAPLPAQPVGVGASWRVERSATLNGVQTNTATTYILQSHSGNDYVLEVAQEATAPPGPAELPGLPPGVTAIIESFLVSSTGEVRGRLDQPLPDNSTIEGSGDIELTVEQGGDSETVSQHLTLDVSLSPGE
jgi:hypothetical protein